MIELLKNPQIVEAWAKLLAAVLWPLTVFILIIWFKRDISSFTKRLKKGKLFGSEFELTQELDEFAKTAEKAKSEIYLPPSTEASQKKELATRDKDTEKILSLASDNPELALILLSNRIEHEMRRLLAKGGHLRGRRSLSYRDMAEYLGKNAAVSENLRKSLQIFWDVRNKIVHGHGGIDRDNLIRTIDIGLTVLESIKSIPHENNVVAHPGAPIFYDSEGKKPVEIGKAVILETTTPGGATKLFRVFPTTKTDYRVGMEVTWEWNFNRTWSDCYYKDPFTGDIKYGWGSSAEFVGRNIEAI